MESFSIRAGCPDQEQLLEALWPKLKEYCEYEVFEYADGKVVTVAFEKYYLRISSNLLVTISLDFTRPGTCQVDLIAGGGAEGLLRIRFGSEKDAITDLIQIIGEICDDKGWKIEEDESESLAQPD